MARGLKRGLGPGRHGRDRLMRLSRLGGDAGDPMTATAELLMVTLERTATAESD